MISQPPPQQNNLGTALSLWNMFMQPGASTPPAGTYVDPQSGDYHAPQPNNYPGQGPSGSLMPKTPSWQGSDPWFSGQQPKSNGTITQPADNSGNLGRTAGALAGAAGGAGGLSGLLASI